MELQYMVENYTTTSASTSVHCANLTMENVKKKSTDQFLTVSRVGVLGVLCIIGLMGNSLAFIVLYKDRRTRSSTWMLRALAVADNAFLITCFFCWNLFTVYFNTSYSKFLRWWYPKVFPFIYWTHRISLTQTQWILMMATYERYRVICKPHIPLTKFSKYSKIAVTTVMPMAASIVNIPRIFEIYLATINKCGKQIVVQKPWLRNYMWYKWYNFVIFSVLNLLLPAILLIYCNIKLLQIVKQSKSLVRASHRVVTNTRLTVMIITVVTVYLLCNLPFSVGWFVHRISSLVNRNPFGSFGIYILVTCQLLLALQSAINCFIYGLMGKTFRRQLLNILCPVQEEGTLSSTSV